nr:hypothetical protein [Candidatus Sigynarchaeota archaeon]
MNQIQKKMVVFFTLVTVLFSMTCFMINVRAAEQVVNPHQFIISSGTVNSTDLSYVSKDDGMLISALSNKSGDRNFYESYQIEKKDDFNRYFTTYQTSSLLVTDVLEEKVARYGESHKKVIRIQDKYHNAYNATDLWYNQQINQKEPILDASVDKTAGFFEFYFLSESTNGVFMVSFGDYAHKRYSLYNSTTYQYSFTGSCLGINFGIAPIVNSTNSSFFYSTSWMDTMHVIENATYIPEKWYHVRLLFTYNASWSIQLDNATVFNSVNWTISPDLEKFDCFSMFTQTRTKASNQTNHVFYLDALGISYNITAHNLVSSMDFNAAYEKYEDVYSINNINDHVVLA